MTARVISGDAARTLATLPSESVHCIVTSPPYYGLRSYLPDCHPDKALEIGLETTPAEYVTKLTAVFAEARRVLRREGTVWLNVGDSYAGSWGAQGHDRITASEDRRWHGSQIRNHPKRAQNTGTIRQAGLKPKDLIGIPWMLAFALRADGWWLRRDNIWHKPNPMPESISDRCTSSHEYVFHLSKSERYYYDADAIAEPSVSDHASGNGFNRAPRESYRDADGPRGSAQEWSDVGGARNRRSVWTITSKPFRGAHFATMPPDLAELCILAGTSAGGCCSSCGSPFRRIVEKGEPDEAWRKACGADASGAYAGEATKEFAAAGAQDASAVKRRILEGMRTKRTVAWRPTCKCAKHRPAPCTVLDPFAGSGTTLLVAERLGRNGLGIDLHPNFAAMAVERVYSDAPLLSALAV